MKDLFFNTINITKKKEISRIFEKTDFLPKFFSYNIEEILSEKLEIVIIKKALLAYSKCKNPVVVEHGALKISHLNDLPGALSKPIWDILNDKICDLIPPEKPRLAKACSAVCYCDGKKVYPFFASTDGIITNGARGTNGFQWDPIFIPTGSSKTYAEMELEEKLEYSQAFKAYSLLIEFLDGKS